MDAEKIKQVQAFNIEAFLDWQSQFYEPLPEWVEDEKRELERNVWSDWEAYSEALKAGKETPAGIDHHISESAEQIIKAHGERLQTVELLDKLETPIMSAGHFIAVKNGIIGGIEREIDAINERIKRGISVPEMILEKRLEEGIELINFILLDWWAGERPILESHGILTLQSLIETGVCQWIIEQKKESPSAKKTKSKPDEWSLPFKICLLNEIGFFNLPTLQNLREWTGKRDELVSMLLGADETNTRKNINALSRNDPSNPKKKHLQAVIEYLEKTKLKE